MYSQGGQYPPQQAYGAPPCQPYGAPPCQAGYYPPAQQPGTGFFRQQDGCPLECPPPGPGMCYYDPNDHSERIANRICVGVEIKGIELQNCHATDCKLIDCDIFGGYYCSTKITDCDVKDVTCLLSCDIKESDLVNCGITNNSICDSDVRSCCLLDTKAEETKFKEGAATRCKFTSCTLKDIRQNDCHVY